MRRWMPMLLLAILGGCSDTAPATKATPASITLTSVKWTDLERAIAAHRGKVVVIDLWAFTCIPCKEKFPHLVELQKKYGQQGLVCMSLSGDEDDDRAKALEFLKKMDAKFENYYWIDTVDSMDDHLGSTAFPSVVVYGRDGNRAKLFTPIDAFDYSDVENLVKELLKK